LTTREPVFFIGHGSPMNALEDNAFTQSLRGMRALCHQPKAFLCVSAHWMTEGTWVTHMEKPKTIHDFYGFPQALFDVEYPAPGSPEVAEMAREAAGPASVHLDDEMWGLDHGAWSVLRHIFPEADVPVVQLSLYMTKPPEYHYEIGRRIGALRDSGVVIVGSGNIVHNLGRMNWSPDADPYDWAVEFDEAMKTHILRRDATAMFTAPRTSEAGRLSVPTLEHYYPLLYAMGAARGDDTLQFHFEDIHNASISMRTFSFSAPP
jgi:4,5-DOPA dioxygenase extradiol